MDDQLIEALSDHVHRAWMDEKQRQGFMDHVWPKDSGYTVTSIKDGVPMLQVTCKVCHGPESTHHADMLPYADLPENVKEYDRATVRTVLKALAATGYVIVRSDAELASTAPDPHDAQQEAR